MFGYKTIVDFIEQNLFNAFKRFYSFDYLEIFKIKYKIKFKGNDLDLNSLY